MTNFRLAFETAFKQYYRKLYFFAFNLLEDEEEAKDIISDTFCSLWEQRNSLQDNGGISLSLLYTMTRNRCIDRLRHLQSKQNYLETIETEPLEILETESYEEHEKRLKCVMEAIEALSPQTRKVFEACFLECLSYNEVAKRYDISPNTVRNHVVMALKKIRAKKLVSLLLSVL